MDAAVLPEQGRKVRSIPKHIIEYYGSKRAYKENKRRDLRFALAAIQRLNNGSAYMPGIDTLRLISELKAAITACSVKEWGR